MAEAFESSSYHVPQQSRRDKLRVGSGGGEEVTVTPAVAAAALNLHHNHNHNHNHQQQQGCAGLLPLYDPSSLLPSDLLTCANQVKEENNNNPGNNLMGFVGGSGISTIPSSSSSSSTSHHHHHHHHHQNSYVDPNTSLPLNPTPIQDINNSTNTATTTTNTNTNNIPFFYSIHSHQLGDVVVYKPEPLSLTHHHHHHHHESSSNASGQGLSLSLSSHDTNNLQNNQNILPLELNLQRYGSAGEHHGGYMIPGIFGGGGGSTSNEVSRSPVPLGPFTGYASILKGSRFLKPAQVLLEELCDVVGRGIYTEKAVPDPSLMDPPVLEGLGERCVVEEGALCHGEDSEFSRKKSRLISMLNEVCRRYKHYFQQMQAVVTSFEYVAGLGNAAPYANLALKAMSRHFKCLKTAISDQLQFTNKACGQGLGHKKDESAKFNDRINFSQRAQHNTGYLDHQPVWRPQRGLPECAVTVLRAWLFDHFLHPYPTDTDKLMLAKQTGLSRSQVSNWFINARVRLWKPMVEEIHMLETQQAQKGSEREEHHINRPIDPPPLASATATEIASTSTQGINGSPAKRTRNELPIVPIRNEDAVNLSYNNMSGPHVNVGEGIGGVSNGVSLTLGLHQNDNRLALSEPFPINAMQRFGLGIEGNNEGYVLGGFETQERHFGRDVFGGQLLHDFVG